MYIGTYVYQTEYISSVLYSPENYSNKKKKMISEWDTMSNRRENNEVHIQKEGTLLVFDTLKPVHTEVS